MLIYIARAAVGGGPNLVCTVLLLSIAMHVTCGRKLGRRLHLQLDNTTSENKNSTVLGFVALLVAWDVFEDATIFFLPVGHTYNELDAAFSPLIKGMLATVVATISALVSFIERALAIKRVRVVRDLPHVWDFTMWLEGFMFNLGGFATSQQSSGMHEFYFAKDADGHVRLRARQSSQASTWLPEGDGDFVFRTVPDPAVPPPIAPLKTDEEWGRAQVSVNIRRWLPYLGMNINDMRAAELEWDSVFRRLPFDGDASKLMVEDLLQWPTLPTRTATADLGVSRKY